MSLPRRRPRLALRPIPLAQPRPRAHPEGSRVRARADRSGSIPLPRGSGIFRRKRLDHHRMPSGMFRPELHTVQQFAPEVRRASVHQRAHERHAPAGQGLGDGPHDGPSLPFVGGTGVRRIRYEVTAIVTWQRPCASGPCRTPASDCLPRRAWKQSVSSAQSYSKCRGGASPPHARRRPRATRITGT